MRRAICLFDVDGTLTKPRNPIQQPMVQCLKNLKQKIDIAYVGGSDIQKIKSQLNPQSIDLASFLFSQNGLLSYKGKQIIGKESIKDKLGELNLNKFLNFCLKYLSQIDIPIKRGTFIEYRSGLINISPIGRNCSQEQRDNFQKYDKQHQIRQKFIDTLQTQFPDFNLKYSIGGQISFDVFPIGWDKTYCLKYLQEYDEIYFFGDKTDKGGNDHQIYEKFKPDNRAFSIKQGPVETIRILEELFLK